MRNCEIFNFECILYFKIGPKKTAYDICAELSSKIKKPVHELQLEEYVLNNNLVRPIHHTEKVILFTVFIL